MRINTYVYTSFSYKVNYADYVNKHINYASKTYFPTFVIIGIPIELFEILEFTFGNRIYLSLFLIKDQIYLLDM